MKFIQLILVLVFFSALGLKAQDNISPERKAAIK